MENNSMLSLYREIDLGLATCDRLTEFLSRGRLSTSEVRSTLREVVQEIGTDHADNYLVDQTVLRILHDMAGGVY